MFIRSLNQVIINIQNNIEELILLGHNEYMGRKKKENSGMEIMQNNSNLNEVTTTLDQLALGIARLKDGTWGVAEIAYNTETGESDLQDVRVAGKSRDDAIELFKITAVEKGLV